MDQNNSNSQNEFLWTLLANPANDAHLHNYNLQRLVNDFPQSGILQALLAHSSDEKNLKQASAYFSPKALYKLINAPSSFVGVSDENIIIQNNTGKENAFTYQHHHTDNEVKENYFSDQDAVETGIAETAHAEDHQPVIEHVVAQPVTETISEISNNIHSEDLEENIIADKHETAHASINEHYEEEEIPEVLNNSYKEEPEQNVITDEQRETSPVQSEIEHDKKIEEGGENLIQKVEDYLPPMMGQEILEYIPFKNTREDHHPDVSPESEVIEHSPVENKIADDHIIVPPVSETHHEESAPIDNHIAESNEHAEITHTNEEKEIVHNVNEHKAEEQPKHAEGNIEDETFDEIIGIENIDIESEIVSNIAATDYFMFDNAFSIQKEPEQAANIPESSIQVTDTSNVETASEKETEQQDVSKYHDEKMPYTFMWWLDKTRKEHADTYQPYLPSETAASVNNKGKLVADALQQQYYENIFHISSFEELDKSTASPPAMPAFDLTRKEDIIIERFIQEEPQIRPQSSDKLDNENKAKKSSEDRDELVTETLAAIYSDQMLYHKAIASYKKLMLKFPEKSRYFAAKIEQLEKKTN